MGYLNFQLPIFYPFIEGSFEVNVPTIWTDEAAEVGRVREEKEAEEKKSEEREREREKAREKIKVHEKVEKLRNAVFF